jgi:hypothetical protein
LISLFFSLSSLSFSFLSPPPHTPLSPRTRAFFSSILGLVRGRFLPRARATAGKRERVALSTFHTRFGGKAESKRKREKLFDLVAAHLEEQAAARAAQQPRQAPAALTLLLRRRRHLSGRRGAVSRRGLHRVLRGHPWLLRSVSLRRDVVRRGASLGEFGVVASRVASGGVGCAGGGRVACFFGGGESRWRRSRLRRRGRGEGATSEICATDNVSSASSLSLFLSLFIPLGRTRRGLRHRGDQEAGDESERRRRRGRKRHVRSESIAFKRARERNFFYEVSSSRLAQSLLHRYVRDVAYPYEILLENLTDPR